MDQRVEVVRALTFRRLSGHQQNGKVGPVFGYFQCQRNAVQFGHDDIRQQQIELISFQRFQGLQPVFGDDDVVPGIGEGAQYELAHGRIVFSNQYSGHAGLKRFGDTAAPYGLLVSKTLITPARQAVFQSRRTTPMNGRLLKR